MARKQQDQEALVFMIIANSLLAGSLTEPASFVGRIMLYFLTLLLASQSSGQPEPVLWQFKQGQDFFVEDTQRQLLQIKGNNNVTSYFDFTYLWRYQVLNANATEATIDATLDKVRINNSTEIGGRASELLKLQEGTKSTWKLTRKDAIWQANPASKTASKHAAPIFLTVGTAQWDPTPPSWKQSWSLPVSNWGTSRLTLQVTLKQQLPERVMVNSRAQLEWQAESASLVKATLQSPGNTTLGLGEFDLSKGRWIFFEYYAIGTWTVARDQKTLQMKQDLYGNFRFYERRPTFP